MTNALDYINALTALTAYWRCNAEQTVGTGDDAVTTASGVPW